VSLSTPRDIHAARRVVAKTTTDANVRVASLVSTDDVKPLGVHVFGANATELVHIGQAVMDCGGTIEYLVDAVFTYPTFAEAYKVAALDMMNKMRKLSQFRAWCRWRHRSRTQTDDASP
jgi:Pyridine nucleotide-disulphide oxidoreductase, dimerisation domain